jgi:hypothetical protein
MSSVSSVGSCDGSSNNDGNDDNSDDNNDTSDSGSQISVLDTTVCSEWNGFLGGMWNILEHVNLSPVNYTGRSTIYDISGVAKSTTEFGVQTGAQTDLLVHDMEGWTQNSYGKVCSTLVNATQGELDGRMVYYKARPKGAGGFDYDFAFAMPFLNGLSGNQFVPYNTYQPSLDSSDANNVLANWIQLTNLTNIRQTGTLIFYNVDGSVAASTAVALEAEARQDFSGHAVGGNKVGIIEWAPDDDLGKFQLRNVRYFYDNPSGAEFFDAAFQLEGSKGTGVLLSAPLDTVGSTSVVEVSNTTSERIRVDVNIYDSSGTLVKSYERFALNPYASWHIIADGDLVNAKGLVTIDSDTPNSVVATVMQYGRTPTLGIQTLYGIQAKPAYGSSLQGSYNTFLNQGCSLLLGNPTDSDVSADINMTRYDGVSALASTNVTVPAKGLVDYDLCTQEIDNTYGVVVVTPSTANSLVANVVRLGEEDQYRFPTPVR